MLDLIRCIFYDIFCINYIPIQQQYSIGFKRKTLQFLYTKQDESGYEIQRKMNEFNYNLKIQKIRKYLFNVQLK